MGPKVWNEEGEAWKLGIEVRYSAHPKDLCKSAMN